MENYSITQMPSYGVCSGYAQSTGGQDFPSYNFRSGSFYFPSLKYGASRKDFRDFIWMVDYSTELKRSDDKDR